MIRSLRELEFGIADIRDMLMNAEDESDLLDHLERQRSAIGAKLGHLRDVESALRKVIRNEREARETMAHATYEVEEKEVPDQLIAGIRVKGPYSDCSEGFGELGKRFGRQIAGKALMLIYDREYRETDADFEVCMPVKKGEGDDRVSVRALPGGRCVSLLHKGPYDDLSRSYEKILAYVSAQGYEVVMPTREVYHKGPGMILKGNPKKYLTELQILVTEGTNDVDPSGAGEGVTA